MQENGGKGLVLRIMRARLQQTLLGKVPPQDIQFGKICTSAVPASQEGQPVKLTFADGSSAEHDLLVVADGANSKLRAAMLPQEQPNYAGVCMLFVRHPDSCDIPNSLIEGKLKPDNCYCGSLSSMHILYSFLGLLKNI